jgi:hypothetical protein
MWKAISIDSHAPAVPVRVARTIQGPDEKKLSDKALGCVVDLREALKANTPWQKDSFKETTCRDAQAALATALYHDQVERQEASEPVRSALDLVGLVAHQSRELPRKWQNVLRHAVVVRILLSGHWQKLRGRAIVTCMVRKVDGRVDTIDPAQTHLPPQDVVVACLQQVGSMLSLRAYHGHQNASGFTYGMEHGDNEGFAFHKDGWLEPGSTRSRDSKAFSRPFRSLDHASDHFDLGIGMCEALLGMIEAEETSTQLNLIRQAIKATPAPTIGDIAGLDANDADAAELGIDVNEVKSLVAYRDECEKHFVEVGPLSFRLPTPWLRFGRGQGVYREHGVPLIELPDGSLGYPAADVCWGQPVHDQIPYRESLGHVLDFSNMGVATREEDGKLRLIPQACMVGGRKQATENLYYIASGERAEGGGVRVCLSFDNLPKEKQWSREKRKPKPQRREKTSATS